MHAVSPKKETERYCSFCLLLQSVIMLCFDFFLSERTIAIRLSEKTVCIFDYSRGAYTKYVTFRRCSYQIWVLMDCYHFGI